MDHSIKVGDTHLILLKGDITELEFDAVVNPANKQLQLGGGVAGAIRSKGGEIIQQECDMIGGTFVGGAVLTSAGNLKAKYIIHAVGPRNGEGDEEIKLRNATMNSLILAEEHNLLSIVFPAISTGIFGYSVVKCAEIMLKVIIDFLTGPTQLKKVAVCLWNDEIFNIFDQQLKLIVKS